MQRSSKVSPAARKRWEASGLAAVWGVRSSRDSPGCQGRICPTASSQGADQAAGTGQPGAAPKPEREAPLWGQEWGEARLGCQGSGSDLCDLNSSSQTSRRGKDTLMALTVSYSLYGFSWVLNFSANIPARISSLQDLQTTEDR